MSNASKRGEGAAEEIGGKIKGAVGKLIDNEQMQAEGKAKELKGAPRSKRRRRPRSVSKGAVEEAVGAVKNRVGALIDDEEMEAEEQGQRAEGRSPSTRQPLTLTAATPKTARSGLCEVRRLRSSASWRLAFPTIASRVSAANLVKGWGPDGCSPWPVTTWINQAVRLATTRRPLECRRLAAGPRP